MKAVILNGAEKDDRDIDNISTIISSELSDSGFEVQSLDLHEMKIAYCLGCFECWTKTPGECRHNDDAREVVRQFIQSDLSVLLTPVTFGGYSSNLKKGLDRIICLISPFFMQINGETHHKKRYDSYPHIIGIGVLPEEDKESERIFTTLVSRNALNAHAPSHSAGVVLRNQESETIRENIRSLLDEIGVVQ
ncbi:MAG: flavodoxin family protein [candidate division Zixibacteria bacterium]|nr:flavodoxin family protein [candidate division Zixibacteria bacterium]